MSQPPEQAEAHPNPKPQLVAECAIDRSTARSKSEPFYSSVQWTADGTSIIAASTDQNISSFVLPQDLLETPGTTHQLQPHSTTKLPEPTQVISVAPYFSLADAATQTFLVGCRDHPIQLYHAFSQPGHSAPLCAYKLIRLETEEHITPASMLWEQTGTHFLCGSANRLDYFDISRYGSDGPILTIPTIPSKRHVLKGGGVGMKGMVSALAASPHDVNGGSIVAAGTWTRWVGMYDLHRTEKVVGHWNIAGADAEEFKVDSSGQGIVQTMWSPCGRYLVINERHSSGLLVYDVRGTGKLLSLLQGRKCATQQKLQCDVFSSPSQDSVGFEVWGGSENGSVLVWDEVGLHYGVKEPSWDWEAHNAPVGTSTLHPSGSVAATCSGAWTHVPDGEVASESSIIGDIDVHKTKVLEESSLRVWSLAGDTTAAQDQ